MHGQQNIKLEQNCYTPQQDVNRKEGEYLQQKYMFVY
jgi:hypothetical protein